MSISKVLSEHKEKNTMVNIEDSKEVLHKEDLSIKGHRFFLMEKEEQHILKGTKISIYMFPLNM